MSTNNITLRQMVEWLRSDITRLENKVDNLQKFRWLAIGYGSAFGTIASIVVAVIVSLL